MGVRNVISTENPNSIREAFISKNRKYIGLLPIGGYPPPPFRRIGNFRFFPRPFSFSVWNFKIITYVPWNRFCIILWVSLWSRGLSTSTLKKEEKKAYLLITFGSQEHNEVFCSPILLNLILLTKMLNNNGTSRIDIFVWGGGGKRVNGGGRISPFWEGGRPLWGGGDYPLGSHAPPPLILDSTALIHF